MSVSDSPTWTKALNAASLLRFESGHSLCAFGGSAPGCVPVVVRPRGGKRWIAVGGIAGLLVSVGFPVSLTHLGGRAIPVCDGL